MRITKIFILGIIVFISLFSIGWLPNKDFINSLKGEVVYVKRDNGILNVYKISANGKNKKMLYHNTDAINSNCSFPKWSGDGSKISFTAMKDGKWRTFMMNSDGSNVEVIENGDYWLLSRPSRVDDIIVEYGSVYIKNDGNKIKVYNFGAYDYKFNPGASEASWSPDKKFIIFQSYSFGFLGIGGGGSILIANKEGTGVFKIAEGMEPDWKY